MKFDEVGLCFHFWLMELSAEFYKLNSTTITESVVLRSGNLLQYVTFPRMTIQFSGGRLTTLEHFFNAKENTLSLLKYLFWL